MKPSPPSSACDASRTSSDSDEGAQRTHWLLVIGSGLIAAAITAVAMPSMDTDVPATAQSSQPATRSPR